MRELQAPRPFDAAFAIGMAFQAWGAWSGAFDSVTGYELVARVSSSFAVAVVLYLVLVRIRAVPDLSGTTDIHERTGIALAATSLGFGVAMLYEVGAWAANDLFDAERLSFDELIAHMGVGLAASAAGAALLVFWDRAGWETRRVPASVLVRR